MVQPIYYPDPSTERIIGIGYRRGLFGRLVIELLIETTHRHPSATLANFQPRTVISRRDARTDDAPSVTEYLRRTQPHLHMIGGTAFFVASKPPAPPAPPPGRVVRESHTPRKPAGEWYRPYP